MNSVSVTKEQIPFEVMSEYIFADERPNDFVATAARINSCVMKNSACKKMYDALISLKNETEKTKLSEPLNESIKNRVLSFLYAMDDSRLLKTVVDECESFKIWASFTIMNMRELNQMGSEVFSHPKLAALMKFSADGRSFEEAESVIKSSLYDGKKNRISIGLDGTLSFYFNGLEHPAGKRVIIIPEDIDENPQMLELKKYDDSISIVRFEGMSPGQYTIVVED